MLLVLCHAGGNQYAVEARYVSEVLPRVALHRAVHAADWNAGLLIHRGRTTPVVDLCLLAGGEECPARLSSRIVVLDAEVGGEARRFGMLAERVDLREVERLPEIGAETASNATAWGRLVLEEEDAYELVEIRRLLSDDRWNVLLPRSEPRN